MPSPPDEVWRINGRIRYFIRERAGLGRLRQGHPKIKKGGRRVEATWPR